MAIDHASEENFEEKVLKSDKATLVDFWAEWCGPCKALLPILEQVDSELEGKYNIVKVDVDANGNLAQQYGIRGIPTMIFFKDGQPQKTLVGAQSKEEIKKSLEEL